jgi:hypothetical protein
MIWRIKLIEIGRNKHSDLFEWSAQSLAIVEKRALEEVSKFLLSP